MDISYNGLQDFVKLEESPSELEEILTQTGLEVDGIKEINQKPLNLEKVFVGEIVSCSPLPNSTNLLITKVDIDQKKHLQIICGAPNVKAGQKVLVATKNALLTSWEGKKIPIRNKKIRGIESEGMICSEYELGIGSNSDGIMVLEPSVKNGIPANEYHTTQPDFIMEISLTPNRGDAASHLGVARDIAVKTKRKLYDQNYQYDKKINVNNPISVKIENPNACPRYSGVTIRDITITPSPDSLQNKLRALGLQPINNVVDITNYIALTLGQPMHAFDANKIKGNQIVVKTLPNKTRFTTLKKKIVKLSDQDLMICDSKKGICIAGVYGGLNSGITDKTTQLFLESAYFSPEWIRRTVQRHQLNTEASFRFERGTDPNITLDALHYATNLILKYAGGYLASEFIDITTPLPPKKFTISFSYFERYLGMAIEKDKIIALLEALDIQCQSINEHDFEVNIPYYRYDVTQPIDLVEEVMRIYGIAHIGKEKNVTVNRIPSTQNITSHQFEEKVSIYLAGKGYHEIMTNSLIHPHYQTQIKVDRHKAIEIFNKSSEDLAFLKTSPVHSGLEVISYNFRRKINNQKIFEFSKIYFHSKKQYHEKRFLTLYLTGNREEANWLKAPSQSQFHDLLGGVLCILEFFNIRNFKRKLITQNPKFEGGVSLYVGKKGLAHVGKIANKLTNYFDIKQKVWYAEINWDNILELIQLEYKFEELPKFPEVKRDLSLVIDKNMNYATLEAIARKSKVKYLKRMQVFSIYEGKNIETGKKSYAISFFLQDSKKTLTDKEIDKTMNQLMLEFEQKAKAIIRK